MSVKIFGKYGDPRRQAAASDQDPHGLTANQVDQMADRMNSMLPTSTSQLGTVRTAIDDILPPNTALAPNAGRGLQASKRRQAAGISSGGNFGGDTGVMQTVQRPYQPEYASSDRQSYPVHRILANRYWRLFYKLDPVIGTCLDMYGELPWGDVTFSGDGVDGEIKDTMEYSWDVCNMRSILPAATREYHVVGEAAPHLFFDDSKGCWTYCALHNPDQLEVVDAPFIKMDPVVEFIPDDRLRQVLHSSHMSLQKVRESMPPELLSRLTTGQNIPLSPINFTFIPRKLHPYDTRGTSIISRLWRILMYEDCGVFGTRVAMSDGTSKNIEDVKVGDTIINQHGKTETVISAVVKDPQPVLQILVKGGKKITVTPNHKWPVKRGDAPLVKMLTSDIRKGDYLAVPRKFEETKSQYSEDVSRLLGYYLAEGCITKLNHLTFTFHEDELETWAADVCQILDTLNVGYKIYPYVGRKALCIRCANLTSEHIDLVEWLREHAGQKSAFKCLSSEVMSWPLSHKKQVLTGYFRGDGSLQTRRGAPTVSIATTSRSLIEQIWALCAQLGWFVGHYRAHNHCGSDGRTRQTLYTCTFSGKTADWLVEHVFNKSNERVNPVRDEYMSFCDDDYMYYQVKAIEEVAPESVVGITVTGDHSYIADGFATYNSIYEASLATARRHAGPLKIAKLGDPATGFMPGPEHEQRLLELLAQAELDVNTWLVYNYAVQFEIIGSSDRVMTIDRHNEVIERIKLIALGVSKAFLHGEVTYACLPYNTPVQCPQGSVMIQDLAPGDFVLDRDGSSQRVVNAWCEGTPDEVTELQLQGGIKLQSTPNHQWPVWAWPRACSCGCGEPVKKAGQSTVHGHGGVAQTKDVEYKIVDRGAAKPRKIPTTHEPVQRLRADAIRPGDFLMVPRTFEEQSPDIHPSQARLLGYYLAEGSVFGDNGRDNLRQVCFSLSSDEYETLAIDIENCCADLGWGVSPWTNWPDGREGKRVNIKTARDGGWRLGNWLADKGGCLSREKRLSPDVMQWSLGLKTEIIRGAFRGDGSQTLVTQTYKGKVSGPYLQVAYTTASREWAYQLWRILIQLGFFATIIHRLRTDKRAGWSDAECWELQLQSDHAVNLANMVWGESSLAPEIKRVRSVREAVIFEEDYAYVPVKQIATVTNDLPVYNIEVENTHSYLVGPGVGTYNSAASGLTVFLRRLKSLRQHFESTWLMPKFFMQMAKINKWVKPTQAELDHRVRVRRSNRELLEDSRYILPTLEWDRSLDPSVDGEMIGAMQSLQQLGVNFSKSTLHSLVGRDFEDESRQRVTDLEFEQQVFKDHPELMAPAGGDDGMGGGMGGGALPGMDPGAFGDLDEGSGEGEVADIPVPDGASATADSGEKPTPTRPDPFKDTDRIGIWSKQDVEELIDMMQGEVPESDPWVDAFKSMDVQSAIRTGDPHEIWEAVEDYLADEQFPSSAVTKLVDILKSMKVLDARESPKSVSAKAKEAQLLEMIGGYGNPDVGF